MKRALFFLFLLFTGINLIKSQVIADFEKPETTIIMNGMANSPIDDACLEIVDNPLSSAVNPSLKVVQFIRSKDGNPWAGFWSSEKAIDVNNQYVHVKVLKTRISPIKFKIEGGENGNLEVFSAAPQTKIDEWEEMVFDFTSKSGVYPTIAFMPDFADPVGLDEDIVIYFDDIEFNDIPPVATQPAADFMADVTSIAPGGSVNFTDLSTGIPASWEWTFVGGDPATSTEKDPQNVQYSAVGNYTVTLKVTNTAGTSTKTKTAYIKVTESATGDRTVVNFEDLTWGSLTYHTMANGSLDVPAAFEIVANPAPGGVNSSTMVGKFTRTSTGNPWAGFWANISPKLDLATKRYVHVKVYKPRISPIKFKVEGGTGIPATLEIVSANEQTKINEWEDIVFDFSSMDSQYPIVAFMPDFADPVDLTENIIIYFDDIILSEDPNPFELPTADFSANVTTLNPGNKVNFTDLSMGNPIAWEWTFEGGNPSTSTESDPQNIQYDAIGNYSVSLKVTSLVGNSTETKVGYIQVIEKYARKIDFEDGTTGPLTLHIMGSGEWDNIDFHQVSETCVVVDNPDASGINASNKVMKFTRRGTTNGGLPWGGFWANIDPTVDVTTNKFVHVKVLKPRISPLKFKLEGATTLETASMNTQTDLNSWQDMVFDFTTLTGEYSLLSFMPDFEDPLTTTDDIVIYFDDILFNNDPTPITGVKEPAKKFQFSIYPNPASGEVFITTNSEINSISIINLMGQKVKTLQNIKLGINNIDVSTLSKGIYIISIKDKNNRTESSKLTIY